nr:DUF4167 domain-containing protein [uncultured Cohaesibacter sp.]
MRQSQKSSRTRSRGRKPSNPLSRSYDSNGPDVKIRGTASHIAEKYQSLARDALASGDMVMAENYYQHAEHYLRIIAAAQASSRDESRNMNNGGGDQPNVERHPRKPAPVPEITGDEPQPDVGDFANTAVEMEVAVLDETSEDAPAKPAAKRRAKVADADASNESDDGDEAKAPAQRRRRRTTYRSRKRTTDAENGGENGPAEDSPQPAVAAEE